MALHGVNAKLPWTSTSIWEFEQLLNLIFEPSFHIIAKPLLLPPLGTVIPYIYSNLFQIPFIFLSPIFVSARKISSGSFNLTSSASVRTAKADLRPRQFHAKIFMRLGGATPQQPPLHQPLGFSHLRFDR